MAHTRIITVIGGNLFEIALRELADARQAVRIAELNDINDWFLTDGLVYSLEIPTVDPTLISGLPST